MTFVRQPSTPAARSSWQQEDSERLGDGLADLGVTASPAQVADLQDYGDLLLKWNRTYNLLGTTDAGTLVRDHLLDSLAILPALRKWMPPGGTLLDIGSGAGLPGIVLAIMLEVPIQLVEPNAKRAAFLRQVIAHCQLKQAVVAQVRIEELARCQRPTTPTVPSLASPAGSASPTRPTGPERSAKPASPDGAPVPHFICRAFTSLQRYTALCRPHLREGSLVLAMKATRVVEEIDELDDWVEVLAVEPLRAASRTIKRNLVVMQQRGTHRPAVFNPPDFDTQSAPGGLLGNHSHDR